MTLCKHVVRFGANSGAYFTTKFRALDMSSSLPSKKFSYRQLSNSLKSHFDKLGRESDKFKIINEQIKKKTDKLHREIKELPFEMIEARRREFDKRDKVFKDQLELFKKDIFKCMGGALVFVSVGAVAVVYIKGPRDDMDE